VFGLGWVGESCGRGVGGRRFAVPAVKDHLREDSREDDDGNEEDEILIVGHSIIIASCILIYISLPYRTAIRADKEGIQLMKLRRKAAGEG
jgi:hypothetical protein